MNQGALYLVMCYLYFQRHTFDQSLASEGCQRYTERLTRSPDREISPEDYQEYL